MKQGLFLMNKLNNYLVIICLVSFAQSANSELLGKVWEVKRGDTLYRISRALVPKDLSSQQRLRTDIIRLNQQVFKKGAGSLYIGARLKLPDFVLSRPAASTQKKTLKARTSGLSEKEVWPVKSGDTLYSIARTFFPISNKKQYRLRQDIKRLNSASFYAGANSMEVGQLLVLPDYVVRKKQKKPDVTISLATPEIPVVSNEPVNDETQIKPEDNKVSKANDKSETVIFEEKPSHPSEKIEAVKDDKPEVVLPAFKNTKNNSSSGDFSSDLSLSAGYSLGGDVAVSATGGHDVTFGSGFHFKLNYDGLWNRKNGYRLALGYQLDEVTAGNDSGEVTQRYLQVLYLYNTYASLVGMGISYHDDILKKTDVNSVITETDYEPAAGFVLLYEYKKLFSSHIAGISYTSLESENAVSNVKTDMSRTEVYYRLAF